MSFKHFIISIACFSASVSVFALSSPTISGPSDGADTWTGVTFDWDAVAGSEFYEIQIDTTLKFNSPAFKNDVEAYISSASYNDDTKEYFSDLYFGKKYYWRVRSINAVDTSDWSMRSITTRDYVSLDSPDADAITWTGVTFDWYAHMGSDFYEIQIDTSLSFNSPAFKNDIEAYISSASYNDDTKEYFSDLYYGEKYHWRVRSINAVDTSDWSMRSITTRDYVSLDSPDDFSLNQSTLGINLNWYAHLGIDFYEVQWDTTNLFNSSLLQSKLETYISSSSNNIDTYHPSGTLLSNQNYFWRVRAINAVDTSQWRSRVFSTGSSINSPEVPVLLSPVDKSIISSGSVQLDWSNASNAKSYEVQYALNSNVSGATTHVNSSSSIGLSNLLLDTTYYWRVRSINGGFYSNWSDIWSFYTGNSSCSATNNSITRSSCKSYISPSGNYTWTSSGVYMDTIVNNMGCDSILTVDLTISSGITSTISPTACKNYVSPSGNYTWTSSGVYMDTIINTSGCDSIITVDLTIDEVDTSVINNSGMLVAKATGALYQWMYCDSSIIINAVNQSFTAIEDGDFALIVAQNGCTDTSSCYTVRDVNVGLIENPFGMDLRLYPNPTTGIFSIDLSGYYTGVKVVVRNILSQEIESRYYPISKEIILDVSKEKSGLYFIDIITQEGNKLTMKMIKGY